MTSSNSKDQIHGSNKEDEPLHSSIPHIDNVNNDKNNNDDVDDDEEQDKSSKQDMRRTPTNQNNTYDTDVEYEEPFKESYRQPYKRSGSTFSFFEAEPIDPLLLEESGIAVARPLAYLVHDNTNTNGHVVEANQEGCYAGRRQRTICLMVVLLLLICIIIGSRVAMTMIAKSEHNGATSLTPSPMPVTIITNAPTDQATVTPRRPFPSSPCQDYQAIDNAIDCVANYARDDICDWYHWSEIYRNCNLPEANIDNYLLPKVKDGLCVWSKWTEEIFIPLYEDYCKEDKEKPYIHIPNTYCQYYTTGGDGPCEDGRSFDDTWQQCEDDGPEVCMGVMWNSCKGPTSDITVNGAWKLMTAGQEVGDADTPTATCGGKDQASGHWDVFVRKGDSIPPNPILNVMDSTNFDDENGKIAILSVDEIKAVIGQDYAKLTNGGDIFSSMHIKGNQGFVLRAVNGRTGREGGLMVWSNSTTAFGSWNPREFSKVGDWMAGDVITLVDYTNVDVDREVARNCNYSLTTGTGWNLAADNIRFGQCGLAGDWWKEMGLEYELEHVAPVRGVWSDSVNLPYSIDYQDLKSGNWITHEMNCTGSTMFASSVFAKKWRLHWESTDLFEAGGLSSYRGGGGLHAELIIEKHA